MKKHLKSGPHSNLRRKRRRGKEGPEETTLSKHGKCDLPAHLHSNSFGWKGERNGAKAGGHSPHGIRINQINVVYI